MISTQADLSKKMKKSLERILRKMAGRQMPKKERNEVYSPLPHLKRPAW